MFVLVDAVDACIEPVCLSVVFQAVAKTAF